MPIAITAYSGEQLENAGRARHHRHRRHHAERHARGLARHQFDADRLHPRRRPAGPGRRLRGGRRPLSRRRLSEPPAGRPARHLRCRADRGAARAAGHALRPQHDRRRDQICHPPARRRTRASASAARSAPTSRPTSSCQRLDPGRATGFRVGALGRAAVARRLRRQSHHRPRELQPGRLGRRGSRSRSTTSDNVFVRLPGDFTQDNSEPARRPPADPGPAHRRAGARRRLRHARRPRSIPSRRSRPVASASIAEVQPGTTGRCGASPPTATTGRDAPIDFDALPAVDVDVPGRLPQPPDLAGAADPLQHGPFNGLLGALLSRRQRRRRSSTCRAARAAVTALTFGDVDTETYAIFGDFTYDFSAEFSVSLGGRYTWDQRTSDIDPRRSISAAAARPSSAAPASSSATTSDFTGTADFEEFTPRASVSFQPAENQTIYASYSRGFKGGGFDPRGVSTAAPDLNGRRLQRAARSSTSCPFDPETVTSYELGYRASLFDRRLHLGLAGFHADYQRRPGAGLGRRGDQRPADLHRHHHQCRQGALPGRRVRRQCGARPRLRAPTATGSTSPGRSAISTPTIASSSTPAASTSPTRADPEHAGMDGERHAQLWRRRWPAAC